MEFINVAEEKSDRLAREANSARTLADIAKEIAEHESWLETADPGFEARMVRISTNAMNENLKDAIGSHERFFGKPDYVN
jgi:hypothetical protein